jgi:hypothetical protein
MIMIARADPHSTTRTISTYARPTAAVASVAGLSGGLQAACGGLVMCGAGDCQLVESHPGT